MIKNQNHLGALCMILSVLFFSFMDCLIKITATDFAVGQVMFSRALFGLIPIFFLIPRNRFKDFYKTKHISLHFHRSFWGSIAMYAIFVGIRNLGLAEVTSMAFSGPIWVVIFSILFLGIKKNIGIRPNKARLNITCPTAKSVAVTLIRQSINEKNKTLNTMQIAPR